MIGALTSASECECTYECSPTIYTSRLHTAVVLVEWPPLNTVPFVSIGRPSPIVF